MKKIKVQLKEKSYEIILSNNSFRGLNKLIKVNYSKLLAIIDQKVYKLHQKLIDNSLSVFTNKNILQLHSREKIKSFSTIMKIHTLLLEKEYDRNSLIIAIGGGVIGDVAGFAASTYMRGIKIIHIPTTLLSMVDSSIGGKTGINFLQRKNIVGTFYQPEIVVVDPVFLSTLPQDEFMSGLGEVIKYAFIGVEKFFDLVNKFLQAGNFSEPEKLNEIIFECISIKSAVVQSDEKEFSLRKILNLGHTFGHAVESNSNFRIKHGIAVVYGIIAALILAKKRKLIDSKQFNKLIQLPLKMNMPLKYLPNPIEVYSLMLSDKKKENTKLKFVIPMEIGKVLIGMEASKKIVQDSLIATNKLISHNY